MTRALAIETAGRDSSVAAVDGGEVVAEATFAGGMRHAAALLPLIAGLVGGRGWTPGDVEEVYVSAGPGSFTGLRIGITVAKTLAVATGVRLVAVPTLAVVVENAPAEATHAVVLLDAKRDQVFAATFERVGGGWVEREPARLDTLPSVLRRAARPVYLLGEGIVAHRHHVPTDAGVIVTDPDSWRPRAGVVARLGAGLAAAGRFVDPDQLLPTYVRRAEAEEKFDAGLFGVKGAVEPARRAGRLDVDQRFAQ